MKTVIQKIRDDTGLEGTVATIGDLQAPDLPMMPDGSCPSDDEPVVIEPGYRADDGCAEIEYPQAGSGEEAAQDYVEDGEWGVEEGGTTWVHVTTWQVAYLWDAESEEAVPFRFFEEYHSVAINPEEPECSDDHEHDWQSPYDVVGGLRENPGVWGHGGGVIVQEVCSHCGLHRTTDTWAQDRCTGEQGLQSIRYHRPEEE